MRQGSEGRRVRFSGSLFGLCLVLSACGDGRKPVEPVRADARPPASVDAYRACRERAAGDAPALIACADAAIDAAGAKIDRPQDRRDLHAALRLIGDAAIERGATGGGQSGLVDFAHRAVTFAHARAALLSGDDTVSTTSSVLPALDRPAAAAWARSRASSCAAHDVPRCAARYDQLLVPLFASDQTAKDPAPMTSTATGLPLPSCEEVRASAQVGGALADAFYARYPKTLASPDSVEAVALDGSDLDNVVRYLVCVASLTDFDPVVAENGVALFASHRHGKAALARLDALATRDDEHSARSAREFRQQIDAYLQGPK